MNDILLDRISEQPGLKLVRIASVRDVSILSAYVPDGDYPLWIAKTSDNPLIREMLRNEYGALSYLRPWASSLGIPVVMDWYDGGDETILIREGLRGAADYVAKPLTSPTRALDAVYGPRLRWLWKFQTTVKPRDVRTWHQVPEQVRESAKFCDPLSSCQALWDAIERYQQQVSHTELAVAVHGDYFPRNILRLGPSGFHVIDWDHFHTGLPLHDYFSLFIGSELFDDGRLTPIDENAMAVVFSQLPICSYAVGNLIERGLKPAEVAFQFYCYLAKFVSQSHGGVDEAPSLRLLDRLTVAGFPPPGTTLAQAW